MFNYDKPSRIFPCMLLTRNHMIFLVEFGINKQLLIFFKDHKIARALGARTILLVYRKIYSCLFIPNCTRNHVITYTYRECYLRQLYSHQKKFIVIRSGILNKSALIDVEHICSFKKQVYFWFLFISKKV